MDTTVDRVNVRQGKVSKEFSEILTPDALKFLYQLHERFNRTRNSLLASRAERQSRLDQGELPEFLPETEAVRSGDWEVASCPADLQNRRVEITGPVDAKMIINALNSGSNIFMADFEDAHSPTWNNCLEGQINLKAAVRRTLSFRSPEGKSYELKDNPAVLLVRPRGLHLNEKHLLVDGIPISASLFDFGLYFFHNADELLKRGSGPYFYIPNLESHLEARLWSEVFRFAEETLQIPFGSIRCTVLLETILAAFEMDEILYELRNYISGLNAGRWDYMFSMIKKLNKQADFMLPDRGQVTMDVPFMQAYCVLLVKTCHRRKAHAMGGMSAFIPSRRDKELNERALAKVREDKQRETRQGFDGTWIAHPDLVGVAREEFDRALGTKPHQKEVLRSEVNVSTRQLLDVRIEGGTVSEAGLRLNISVALQYLDNWLRGTGSAAIFNLMEDAATAEISRSQIWLWRMRATRLDDGRTVTAELYQQMKAQEMSKLTVNGAGLLKEAAELLDRLVLCDQFIEFLTVPAYDLMIENAGLKPNGDE